MFVCLYHLNNVILNTSVSKHFTSRNKNYNSAVEIQIFRGKKGVGEVIYGLKDTLKSNKYQSSKQIKFSDENVI